MTKFTVLASLTALLVAVAADNYFIEPPRSETDKDWQKNPTYKAGDKINVRWQSDFKVMGLGIWQDYPSASSSSQYYHDIEVNSTDSNFEWTVSLDKLATNVGKGESVVCYFHFWNEDTEQVGATSHYFNITIPDNEEQTTTQRTTATTTQSAAATSTSGIITILNTVGPSSSTSTESTSSSPTEISPSKSSPTGSVVASDATNDGMSTSVVAGIAVGATLGAVAVIGALGYLLWRHSRKAKNAGGKVYTESKELEADTHFGSLPRAENESLDVSSPFHGSSSALHELPLSVQRYELPGRDEDIGRPTDDPFRNENSI